MHHHVCPPAWVRDAWDQIAATNRNTATITDWTPRRSLDDMGQNGVRTSMLSITNPGVWFGDDAKARKLARECNDYMALMKRDHPGS